MSLGEISQSLDYNDSSVRSLEPFSDWLTASRLDLLAPLKSLEEMFKRFLIRTSNSTYSLNAAFAPVLHNRSELLNIVPLIKFKNINRGGTFSHLAQTCHSRL
jgi:hypothetical protein